MNKSNLVPNKSYGYFILGDNIINYLEHPHTITHIEEKLYSYDRYNFYEDNIIIWTETETIDTIRCEIECFWKGKNLIGLLFEEFLTLSNQNPDDEDILYVPINKDRGQNQKVYTFWQLGLQVWVWRKKIVTVLISNYEE